MRTRTELQEEMKVLYEDIKKAEEDGRFNIADDLEEELARVKKEHSNYSITPVKRN